MKPVTFLLLGHLAVADMFYGLAIFGRIFFLLEGHLGKLPCVLTNALTGLSCGCSMTGILFLCVDSYIATRNCMRAGKQNLTIRQVRIMVAVCWITWCCYELFLGISTLLNDVSLAPCYLGGGYYTKSDLLARPLAYFIHLLSVTYLQITTLIMARRAHRHLLQPQPVQPSTTNNSVTPHPNTHTGRVHEQLINVSSSMGLRFRDGLLPCRSRARQSTTQTTTNRTTVQISGQHTSIQQRRLQRLSNMAVIISLILLNYFICWTPVMLGLLMFCVCKVSCGIDGDDLLNFATLLMVSSFLNVFLYAAKSSEFRSTVKQLLRGVCKNRVSPSQPAVSFIDTAN